MLEQMKYIISNSAADIVEFIKIARKTYCAESVFFVVDPSKSPNYLLDDTIQNNYSQALFAAHTSSRLSLNLKERERELRRKASDRTSATTTITNKIRQQLSDDVSFNAVNELYRQSDYYNNAGNRMKLIPIIISDIYEMAKNIHDFFIIQSISEADFVIKNIAQLYSNDTVLIMSADTDYYVLVADLENVYKTEIRIGRPVHYPWRFWQDIICEGVSFDIICRVATMCGNDYTAHRYRISAENMAHIRAICNVDDTFSSLCKSRLRNIKPMLRCNKPVAITTAEEFDAMVEFDTDSMFIENYYYSVLIYTNWTLNSAFKCYSGDPVDGHIKRIIGQMLKEFVTIHNWDPSVLKYNSDDEIDMSTIPIISDPLEFYNELPVNLSGMMSSRVKMPEGFEEMFEMVEKMDSRMDMAVYYDQAIIKVNEKHESETEADGCDQSTICDPIPTHND